MDDAVESRTLPLWQEPVVTIVFSCDRDGQRYWSLRLQGRREHAGWGDDRPRSYAGLSTTELLDVVTAELERLLG